MVFPGRGDYKDIKRPIAVVTCQTVHAGLLPGRPAVCGSAFLAGNTSVNVGAFYSLVNV